MTRILIATLAVLTLTSCSTFKASDTIAGGACGEVDYSVIILGTPAIGVQASRPCPEEAEE